MVAASFRRFDLGSTSQPIFQFVGATVPLLFLLVWFVLNAHAQLQTSCYDDKEFYDEQSLAKFEAECSKYIPLKQFVYVFVAIYFCCILLEAYILFFVPLRHALIHQYLSQGETVIGNVYYKPSKHNLTLTSHGHAVYEHESTRIRRKVQVFERYTRELAAILILPGLPYSGQPKVDLEIDRDSFELNKPRMNILAWYVGVWSLFCFVAPTYIVRNIGLIDSNNGSGSAIGPLLIFILVTLCVIPVVVFIWIYAMWIMYKQWMTLHHKILDDDELADEPQSGCCFDDHDCESVQMTDYVHMSAPETTTAGKKVKLGLA
jgi:hypothetical protein